MKNMKIIVPVRGFLFIPALALVFAGCNTYTKKSRTCKDGVCTTVVEKCEKGACTTTRCTNGKCVTTYSGSHPLAAKKGKTEDNKSGGIKVAAKTHRPTANHRIIMAFMDGYSGSRNRHDDETSAMHRDRMKRFDKSVFRKVRFSKLCLEDVRENCVAGLGECRDYTVIFSIPLAEGGNCGDDREAGYRAPAVIKHHVCREEALSYRPGARYDVSGTVSSYRLDRPEEGNERDFISKYFHKSPDNSIELDKQEYYRCVKKRGR
jgi:hypothetical protein